MNPEQQQRVRALFDYALTLPSAQRLPYLQSASHGDPQVYEVAARLLASHEQAQSFMESMEAPPHPPSAPVHDSYRETVPAPASGSFPPLASSGAPAPLVASSGAPAPLVASGVAPAPPSRVTRSDAETQPVSASTPPTVPPASNPRTTSSDAQTVPAPGFPAASAPRPPSAQPPPTYPPPAQHPSPQYQSGGAAAPQPAPSHPPSSFDQATTQRQPGEQWIGIYRIIRTLGEGGMGTVYLAMRSDDAFRKIVALKLIRRGRATPEFVERFRQERQLLAGLDHPNIARIVDGGSTDDGNPYYVMDFVEGSPLDEYCEANKLDAVGILRIFRQICSAVQYLHENLVVHRDLKPSNIMVTRDGTAKLLDFGIAKFQGLPGHGAAFDEADRILTPAYASPEQMRGETVDKSSDIYALGAILYELLTGNPSYEDSAGGQAKYTAISSGIEPPKPSTRVREDSPRMKELAPRLRQSLAGDLDAIVLTALQTVPGRRYPSAAAMSEDIQRYLEGHEVSVRKASAIERGSKLVKRRPLAVAAVVAILGLGGFGGYKAVDVYVERGRVDAKEMEIEQLLTLLQNQAMAGEFSPQDLDKVQKVLQTDLPQVMKMSPGATKRREAIVQQSVNILKSASEKHDPALDLKIASLYQTAGDLQRSDRGLANPQAAAKTYRESGELLSSLAAKNPGDPAIMNQIAEVKSKLSEIGAMPMPPAPGEAGSNPAPERGSGGSPAPTTGGSAGPGSGGSPAPSHPAPETFHPAQPHPVVAGGGSSPSSSPGPSSPGSSSPGSPGPAPSGGTPAPVQPAPAVVQAPKVDPAALREVRQRYASVSARVSTAESMIDPIRRNLEKSGQSLAGDTLAAIASMKSSLEEAKQEMSEGDLAGAKDSLDRAEAYAARVLKVAGR